MAQSSGIFIISFQLNKDLIMKSVRKNSKLYKRSANKTCKLNYSVLSSAESEFIPKNENRVMYSSFRDKYFFLEIPFLLEITLLNKAEYSIRRYRKSLSDIHRILPMFSVTRFCTYCDHEFNSEKYTIDKCPECGKKLEDNRFLLHLGAIEYEIVKSGHEHSCKIKFP